MDRTAQATSASYGLFLVVSKRWLESHDPLGSIARVFAIGTLGIAVYGLDETLTVEWSTLPSSWWVWATFIVLFPTIGAYFLNYWALRRAPSSLVALFVYLQPVVATVLDGVLRRSWPESRFYPAAALVLAGVALGALRRRSGEPTRPGGP